LKIKLRLNNALYNAALFGFIKVLEKKGIYVKGLCNENVIEFDSDLLNNFTEYYFRTIMDEHGKDVPYTKMMNLYEASKINLDNAKSFIDLMDKKLKSNSYKAAYEIIRAKGETFDALEELKRIKSFKKPEDRLMQCEKMIEFLHKYKEVFLMKDIAYIKIAPFWNNAAFLNNNYLKKDMKEEYKKYFELPALEFVSKDRKKAKVVKHCIECGAGVTSKEACSMSFLDGQGVDVNRKTSHFWNGNVDICLCPVCNLVYSCLPIGFKMVENQGIFINNSISFEKLVSMNVGFEVDFANEQNELTERAIYSIINTFDRETVAEKADKEISNIQIVRRKKVGDSTKYEITNLSKSKLLRLKRCAKKLKRLTSISIKIDEEWYNVYEEVITRIFSNTSLYKFIWLLLRDAYENGSKGAFIKNIIDIQIIMFTREEKAMDALANKAFLAGLAGDNLRKTMINNLGPDEKDDIENKIRGFVYQLLNALKTNNPEKFLDVILRYYSGMGKSVPTVFCDMVIDKEAFQAIGYSYLLGLKGGIYNKKEEDNNA